MWGNIIKFFDSNFFVSLSTITTVGGAIWVYKKQINNERITAARIVYAEITNAEKEIEQIKNTGIVSELSSVLPTNSWIKNNHFFIKELAAEDINILNSFYNHCFVVEKEIQNLKRALPIAMEEKMKLIQNKLLELADQNKHADKDLYQKDKAALLEIFHKEEYFFVPSEPTRRLIDYIQKIRFISSTIVNEKIKKIAKL